MINDDLVQIFARTDMANRDKTREDMVEILKYNHTKS